MPAKKPVAKPMAKKMAMKKPVAKKAVAKKAVSAAKSKTAATPKLVRNSGVNLKQGGLAPGSKQVEIRRAQRKVPEALENGSLKEQFKDIYNSGPQGKAVKELNKLRKEVGWKEVNKYTANMPGRKMLSGSVVDKRNLKNMTKNKTKKK